MSSFPTNFTVASTGSGGSGGSKRYRNELFVGNLSYFCQENDLYQFLDGYCHVSNVRIMRGVTNNSNGKPHRPLLFGFVTVATVQEAHEMSKLMTGMIFMGRKLR